MSSFDSFVANVSDFASSAAQTAQEAAQSGLETVQTAANDAFEQEKRIAQEQRRRAASKTHLSRIPVAMLHDPRHAEMQLAANRDLLIEVSPCIYP